MKPYVICHMLISLDGRIHPSRWTQSPDGDRKVWSSLYERVHESLAGNAWLVGRVTMAEMSKAEAHPPEPPFAVTRPHHFARRDADTHAIAFDRSGKLGSMMAAGVVDEISILLAPAVDGAVGITGLSRSRTRAASRARRASASRRTRHSITASCTFVTPSSRRSRIEGSATRR